MTERQTITPRSPKTESMPWRSTSDPHSCTTQRFPGAVNE